MRSLDIANVEDVMIRQLVVVKASNSMVEVANVFVEHDINSAPVMNESGRCVGIITSHDLVEYESVRQDVQNELRHGEVFDSAHYGNGIELRFPGARFDEAGFHMTKSIQTAKIGDPLSQVASRMCSRHIHHVLVLDELDKPVGMLSSLDVLAYLTGESVCRSKN